MDNSLSKRYINLKIIIILLIILAIFVIFSSLDTVEMTLVYNYKLYTIIASFAYLVIFITTPKKVFGKFNIYLVFMLLTIPFYFGGQILILLGYEKKLSLEYYSLVDGRIEIKYIIEAMQYIILSLLAIHLGYLIGYKFKKDNNSFKSRVYSKEKKSVLCKISITIILITLIPTIARLIYDIIMAKSYGHLNAFNMRSDEEYLGIWYVFTFLMGWFLPACYITLLTSKNKLINRCVYFLILIYCILYLLCGSRYQIIEVVVAVCLIYFYGNNNKMKKKNLFGLLFLFLILLVILRSVSYTRDASGSGLSFDSLKEVITGGFIYEILFETSTTFTSIANIFKHCPSTLNYNYGLSVIGSVLYIFPAFLRPENNILLHISSELSPLYYGYVGSGYGSAFLTEAYFNYGYFSYIFMIIFGIFISYISNYICSYRKEESNIFYFVISMFIFVQLIWGIRSDLYLIPRHVVHYIILPFLAVHFFWREDNYVKKYNCSNLL